MPSDNERRALEIMRGEIPGGLETPHDELLDIPHELLVSMFYDLQRRVKALEQCKGERSENGSSKYGQSGAASGGSH